MDTYYKQRWDLLASEQQGASAQAVTAVRGAENKYQRWATDLYAAQQAGKAIAGLTPPATDTWSAQQSSEASASAAATAPEAVGTAVPTAAAATSLL
eukprot:6810308-Pyramimonas_sp.AAC.1